MDVSVLTAYKSELRRVATILKDKDHVVKKRKRAEPEEVWTSKCRIDKYVTGKDIVLVCRVPKIRKEEKVPKQTRKQRKQRCGAVVGEIRRMLGEEHRLTEAEVNDYDEMVKDMYKSYAAMPDEKQIENLAYQALLHMDCNVMSNKQVSALLHAVKHPFLSGQQALRAVEVSARRAASDLQCTVPVAVLLQYFKTHGYQHLCTGTLIGFEIFQEVNEGLGISARIRTVPFLLDVKLKAHSLTSLKEGEEGDGGEEAATEG
eukprot:g42679.t1